MSIFRLTTLVMAAMIMALAAPVYADIELPSIFGNSMVLQRNKPIPVWGWDTPGSKVTVTVGEASQTATTGADGKWTLELPAMKAGGPFEVSITGSTSVTLTDVLVGEVWLCSGQSNMEWSVRQSANAEEEIQSAQHPKVRHIKFPHRPSDKPEERIKSDGWKVCNPENVGKFTGVGYYFARHLQKELSVPIGIIGNNWGGTRIEPWTPPEGFRRVPALSEIASNLENFPSKNNEGVVIHQSPLALYNGMIHPIVPYAIAGSIWYQGESNNGEGMLYHEKMKALILGWREIWNEPDLPFYFVQLAPYVYGRRDPTHLAGIWEAQAATLSIPHTGMAVTVDIGNVKDIHPKNKQEVGRRLALWALAKTYYRDGIVYSGPIIKDMAVDGSSIRLGFDHVAGGLVSRDGQPLSHFQISGENKAFVDAKAKIVGDTVVVSAESVAAPLHVRFAWNQAAEPNLSNKEGLPASPFRTDKW